MSNVTPIRQARKSKDKPPLKIRMRGKISAKGNLYWVIYINHPYRHRTSNSPWGFTPAECWHSLQYNYLPYGYQPQMKPSCLSRHAQA